MTVLDRNMAIDRLALNILRRGERDFVYISEVRDEIRRAGFPVELSRALGTGVIGLLIRHELIEMGEFVNDIGLVPWDLTPSESLMEVVSRWAEFGDGPIYPGAVAWFGLTSAGRAEIEAIDDWSELTHPESTDGHG